MEELEREQVKQQIRKRLFEITKRFFTFILIAMLIMSLISPLFSSIF